MNNQYTKLFNSFLNNCDIGLEKHPDGRWSIYDKQGVLFGEEEYFINAEQIIDRIDFLIDYHVDMLSTAYEEMVNEQEGDELIINWKDRQEVIDILRPILHEYRYDIDMLDALVNHAAEIDLDYCKYVEAIK